MILKAPFYPADILLPQNANYSKWSVVACDQYTSEPDYWERVRQFVGSEPSTLSITLPEIYLNDSDVEEKISSINTTMTEMLTKNVFQVFPQSIFYLERTLANGKKRCGLVGAVDLEEYSFEKGSQSKIRATEGTILERIPPRVRVRKHAPIELPHIMLLIDDRQKSVIEPLENSFKDEQLVYNFDLMEQGGKAKGYCLNEQQTKSILSALDCLGDKKAFSEKYNVSDAGVLIFAVGDGNHSLATAKTCYEELKKTMPPEQYLLHPARYALAEVVNLHNEALDFEPIHRVVFDVDTQKMLSEMKEVFSADENAGSDQSFRYITPSEKGKINIKNPTSNLTVGSLQKFIDGYIAENGGTVDYIHGDEVVEKLCSKERTLGFLLPAMEKNDLFKTVILDGALPRKTFSMGHSNDKRFYLESRRISD